MCTVEGPSEWNDTYILWATPQGRYGHEPHLSIPLDGTSSTVLLRPAFPLPGNLSRVNATLVLPIRKVPAAPLEASIAIAPTIWSGPEDAAPSDATSDTTVERVRQNAIATTGLAALRLSADETWTINLTGDERLRRGGSVAYVVRNTTAPSPTAVADRLLFHSSDSATTPRLRLEAEVAPPRPVSWSIDGRPVDATAGAWIRPGVPHTVRLSVEDARGPPLQASLDVGHQRIALTRVQGNASHSLLEGRWVPTGGGSHDPRLDLVDVDGNPWSLANPSYLAMGRVHLDETPPVITASAPGTGATGEPLPVTIALNEPATVTVTIDATSTTQPVTNSTVVLVTPAEPGDRSLAIEAVDRAGNVGTRVLNVTVRDTRPPEANLAIQMRPGVRSEAGAPLTITATAADRTRVANVRFEVSGPESHQFEGPLDNGTARWSFTPRLPGEYFLTATATSTEGISDAPIVRAFTVEPATDPRIHLTPQSGTISAATLFTITVLDPSVEARNVSVAATTDDGASRGFAPFVWRPVTGGITTNATLLLLPPHGSRLHLIVDAHDAVGRRALAVASYLVDRQAPAVQLRLDGPGKDQGGTLVLGRWTVVQAWADEPGSDLQLFVEGQPRGDAITAEFLEDGWRLVAQARDPAGNVATTLPKAVRIDRDPPLLNVTATPDGIVAWAADDGLGPGLVTLEIVTPDRHRVVVEGIATATVPVIGWPRGTPVEARAHAADAGGLATDWEGVVPLVNHRPGLQVHQPPPGSLLRGVVTVTTTTFDADGDPVRVTARLVAEGKRWAAPNATSQRGGAAVTLDTTLAPDGPYVLEVVADDGREATVLQLPVRVSNGVPAGEFRATRGGVATARVVEGTGVSILAGTPAGPVVVPMRDDGVAPDAAAGDGLYAAIVPSDAQWALVRVQTDRGVADSDRVTFQTGPPPWVLPVVLVALVGTAVGIAAWQRRHNG